MVGARFAIGQLVHHKLFSYRGVVYDVDPIYSGSDQWYEEVARTRPPKDRPWYKVLVDGSRQVTYVAERNLEVDSTGKPVRHPAVGLVFESFKGGAYVPKRATQ